MSSHIRETKDLVHSLRATADRLEKEDYGGLTAVALVVEAKEGVFKERGPMVGAWALPKGRGVLMGLVQVATDIVALRKVKKDKMQ